MHSCDGGGGGIKHPGEAHRNFKQSLSDRSKVEDYLWDPQLYLKYIKKYIEKE